MSKVEVRLEHDGQLAWLVLSAPKANILDAEMMREAIGAIERLAAAPALKLLAIRGAGDHFCFGASVEEHQAQPSREMIPLFGKLFRTLIEAGIPTLAAVRGQCLGGGMELALFCNWVFAHPSARFGQPEIRLGVFPPVAAILLPLLAGQAAADDICLTGRVYSAAEAQQRRLVHAVAEDLDGAVQEFFVQQIAPHSAQGLRLALRAVRHRFNRTFIDSWQQMERLYLDELMATHDANEGIQAFIDKRQPIWLHR
jgi:cyclohexa-1,5-dienecarbonyl-CoA hydratase